MSLNVGSLVAYLDLNDTNFDRKTKNANKQIDGLALHLKTLAQLDPELKVRTEAAQAKLKLLQDRLVELKEQAKTGADVRVDTAETMFKLAAVKAEIHTLHREAAKSLELNTGSADAKLQQLAKSLDNVGGKLKGLKVPGGFLGTAAALGPALIPAGNAAIGVLGGITAGAFEAASAVGVLALAFKGASGSVTAYQAYQTAMMKATTAKQRAAATNTLNASAYGRAPAATQAFARFDVNELKPFGASLSAAAQAGLLPGLTTGLRSFIKDSPEIKGAISAIAHSLGSLFAEGGQALKSPFWKQWLTFFGKDSAANVKTMGHTIGQLFEGVARSLERLSPQTHTLMGDVDNLATRFNNWTASDKFAAFLARVQADGHQVSGILKMLGTDLKPLLVGAGSAGRAELTVIGDFLTGVSKLPTAWLVAAGKYLPLIFLATKVGGGSLNALGGGLQALSKGMTASSGLLSKIGLSKLAGLLGTDSKLGGIVGKISQATATPVYVTNWPGGSGIPGLPGSSNPDAKTPRIPPIITNALPKVLKFGGAAATLYTILPGQGGDSGQPLNPQGVRLEHLYKEVGSDSFGHGFKQKISDLIEYDTTKATTILRQYARDSHTSLQGVIKGFDLGPAFTKAQRDAAQSAAAFKLLLGGIPPKVTTKAELDRSPFQHGLIGLDLAKQAAMTPVVIPVRADTSKAVASIMSVLNLIPGGFANVFGTAAPHAKGGKSKVGHNALGTNNWRGGWTEVGENGPELVYVDRGARIIPNGRAQQMAGVGIRGASTSHGPVELSDHSVAKLAKAIIAGAQSTVLNELQFAGL